MECTIKNFMILNNMKTFDAWKKTLIREDETIANAIQNLNISSLQIILVVNKNNELIGTISDGDIRRAFLKGMGLKDKLFDIVNYKPIVVDKNTEVDQVIEMMERNSVRQIPILNQHNRVIGLHLYENIKSDKELDNLFVIMAGGKGTRLKPYTENCPKPMLKIRNKPILEHIIDQARNQGFKQIVISINYLGEIIQKHFEDGKNFGVNIRYLNENNYLGTAGSLYLLEKENRKPIIVSNGDILTNIKYNDMLIFHEKNKAKATMAVNYQEFEYPYGIVKLKNNKIIDFDEKPNFKFQVNAGVYILDENIISQIPKNKYCDMPDFFLKMKKKKMNIIAYPLFEQWHDIGRLDDYNRLISKGKN